MHVSVRRLYSSKGRPCVRQALSSKFCTGSTTLWPFSLGVVEWFFRCVGQYEARHTRQDFFAFNFRSVQMSQATSPGAPVYSSSFFVFSSSFLGVFFISSTMLLSTMLTSGVFLRCSLHRGHPTSQLYLKAPSRHFLQKEWPQVVVTGFWNGSMQMEQRRCFSRRLVLQGEARAEAINNVVAPVFRLGAHGTDARPIAPAELVQPLPVQPAHRVLQVLPHADQEMAPEIFSPVVRLQMSGAVGGQARQAGLDRPAFRRAQITGNLSGFKRRRRLLARGAGVLRLDRDELRPRGERGLAEWALTGRLDPPVFADTAQAEAVSTGQESRAAELTQTDAALRRLGHRGLRTSVQTHLPLLGKRAAQSDSAISHKLTDG
ncbi:hypothetical protein EYF80_049155 [Liparis tanakae]|uniref:Transmembrane protein n=1 Tax=Liparis tanakae TaxID=230148 RepID=A0A4Z2FHJ1_9TELE|nr:hypothetical protein EYF80_049155 [Liparis tanakae]